MGDDRSVRRLHKVCSTNKIQGTLFIIAKQMRKEHTSASLGLRGKADEWTDCGQGILKVHRAVRFAADAPAEQVTWG